MILITGANGQVGQELQKQLQNNEAIFANKEQLNICEMESVENFFNNKEIDIVINCAAYTAVDLAESQKEIAFLVNEKGAQNLAKICKAKNIPLVHLSTDYVFNGEQSSPIDEAAKTFPLGVYGKSKLAGEKRILEINPRGFIIRTSWLYSPYGKNFVKTIIKIAQEKPAINVVSDQFGTPTNVSDLVTVILQLIKKPEIESGIDILHFSNLGETSWWEFAKEIVQLNNINCVVNPIKTSDYPTAAERPKYSVLSKTKIQEKYKIEILDWRKSLRRYFNLT